jgi:hypothetical protein
MSARKNYLFIWLSYRLLFVIHTPASWIFSILALSLNAAHSHWLQTVIYSVYRISFWYISPGFIVVFKNKFFIRFRWNARIITNIKFIHQRFITKFYFWNCITEGRVSVALPTIERLMQNIQVTSETQHL